MPEIPHDPKAVEADRCDPRRGRDARGFGAGQAILGALRKSAAVLLPDRLAQKALVATDAYYRPRPAYVYEIPPGCKFQFTAQDGPKRSAQHHQSEEVDS